MKQPFWILNSILLVMFVGALFFILFGKVKIPSKQSIEPYDISSEQKGPKVDLELIYKNDLFNTFQPMPVFVQPEIKVEAIPTPPRPVSPAIPETPTPHFFDPLSLTLTGIIAQDDENKNIAIIMDNKTQDQVNYKVGDEIEDAQIVRILKDKIILIRSNGQQEILYLHQDDVKLDSPLTQKTFEGVVRKIGDNSFIIDPTKFAQNVKNISEIVDVFNLSTAFKQGIPMGKKVGKLKPSSLPYEMGFLPGDIIIKVNDIPTDTTDNAYAAYEEIINKNENDTINVEVLRNNISIEIKYKIQKILKPKYSNFKSGTKNQIQKVDENRIEQEKIRILKEKNQFAPTLDELRSRERHNMFKRGVKVT